MTKTKSRVDANIPMTLLSATAIANPIMHVVAIIANNKNNHLIFFKMNALQIENIMYFKNKKYSNKPLRTFYTKYF
jgi:hypothetical protein